MYQPSLRDLTDAAYKPGVKTPGYCQLLLSEQASVSDCLKLFAEYDSDKTVTARIQSTIRNKTIGALVACLLCWPAKSDVVILQNGKTITGTILQQDADGILFQLDYGTVRYDKPYIKDIVKEQTTAEAATVTRRIPGWSKIISILATNAWAQKLKQIPATVIDIGVLKNVPYVSFRCSGSGYEINIYGDLDNPAGFEVGAINHLAKHGPAKTNCLNFIADVLAVNEDKSIVRAFNLNGKDTQKRDGMSFEITLPGEPDAYGGWWISVYDESALAMSRATGAELLAISQPKERLKFQPAVALPTETVVAAPTWTSSDISYSRPSPDSSSEGGGRVYVRGYTRKDGTYVQTHTRSSPSRR